jgi:hypothetical protein
MCRTRFGARFLKTWLGTAVAFAMALGVVGSAFGEDLMSTGEFGWLGAGTTQQLFWVGEFSGTFFRDKGEGGPFHLAGVRRPGSNDPEKNNAARTRHVGDRHIRAQSQSHRLARGTCSSKPSKRC